MSGVSSFFHLFLLHVLPYFLSHRGNPTHHRVSCMVACPTSSWPSVYSVSHPLGFFTLHLSWVFFILSYSIVSCMTACCARFRHLSPCIRIPGEDPPPVLHLLVPALCFSILCLFSYHTEPTRSWIILYVHQIILSAYAILVLVPHLSMIVFVE